MLTIVAGRDISIMKLISLMFALSYTFLIFNYSLILYTEKELLQWLELVPCKEASRLQKSLLDLQEQSQEVENRIEVKEQKSFSLYFPFIAFC